MALADLKERLSSSKGDFKQSASDNNMNISKIAKDLSNAVFSQKKDISSLSSSIEESLNVSSQTSSKIEQTNSLLQESISIQNSMLTQLKTIASYIKQNKEDDKSGKGGWLNILGKIAAGGAIGAGGVIAANEMAKKQPGNSGSGSIDLNKKFSDLTEEEKTKFLEKQTKAEGVRAELNNPGAIQFGEHAKKYGAEAGPNNGTITLSKFPSMEKGKEAHRALWEGPKYSNLSLNQGLNKWVTGNENTPAPETYKKVFNQGSASKPVSEEDTSGKGDGKKEDKSSKDGLATIHSKNGAAKVAAEYASNFQGFIDELEANGYQIKDLSGFADRNIAGSNNKSWHSKGMAIDINPGSNPVTYGEPGRAPKTDMPENVGEIAAKYGLGWGGKWDGQKQDAMHFSLGEGPGAIFRGQGLEAASKKGGSGDQTAESSKGEASKDSGSKIPETSAGSTIGPKSFPDTYMGGKVIPFEPKRGIEKGFPGQGGIFGSILSALSPSRSEDAPMPQTQAAKGNLTPSYAESGSPQDTAANFFAADKDSTAKVLQQKATEEAALRQTADEAATKKAEPQKTQQADASYQRQHTINPGSKSDDSAFGKGDWAGDVLRYYGVNAA